MAKISLARKKELNEPDEFINISNQIVQQIRNHKEKVFGVIAAIVLIIVGLTGYKFYSDYFAQKAFTALSNDIAWYQSGAEKNETKSLKEVKTRSEAFFSKYSGTMAGTLARAKYASIYYAEGDYTSAIALYKRLSKDLNANKALQNMALSGLAYSYEAIKNYEEAVKTFEEIANGNNSLKKDDALFHLGLIYEMQNKMEKSREVFENIVSYHTDSIYIEVAKEKISG